MGALGSWCVTSVDSGWSLILATPRIAAVARGILQSNWSSVRRLLTHSEAFMLRPMLGLSLSVLLMACASTPESTGAREPAAEMVTSFEEGCDEEKSVVLLCSEEECGFFQCRDILVHPIVLTRGGIRPPAAAPGGAPRRWWGKWPWLRSHSKPVLTFRFRASLDPKPPPPQLPPGRYIRHHIFSQAPDLKAWFIKQGVKIHDYTIVIPEHIHFRIHGGGARGGAWNQAWREFMLANREASPEAIYRHAGELFYRFELIGPIVPYYSGRR